MNRREFLRGAAAAGVVLALPLPAPASVVEPLPPAYFGTVWIDNPAVDIERLILAAFRLEPEYFVIEEKVQWRGVSISA